MDDAIELSGHTPCLILAPHADDEVLGCGALLADRWQAGKPAHVVCLTDGAASHPRSALDLTELRARELADAVSILGGDPRTDLTCLRYPDAALHDVPRHIVIRALEVLIRRLGSHILVAPSPLDPHCDHVTTASIAETLLERHPQLHLLYYPIWSRWLGRGQAPRVPGTRRITYPVNASLKSRAIAAHASQQGHVIFDDPEGFTMPAGFVEMFAQGPEIYDERSE
ncbi:PIG-L family deacetylase [Salipiger sp. IMCC34102]|uniref:PIG-L deacetylase family protein n=1 Tax=Salipiger sp. IMCC34102 TaxID=2510647 RepID=UPI00101D50B7|nr:PIG-L deacetylase family protein [Salipiger sp. IMCC34102]RYH00817.1 PIG-L family deacetylase [Salipiger sp. IMCC34102]